MALGTEIVIRWLKVDWTDFTHYHTLFNTASWTVWPPPTTLYDQLWFHVVPIMFVNLIVLPSNFWKRFGFSGITSPQILFIKHFWWWLTGGAFLCSLLKINKNLHHNDQVTGRRRFWNLRQVLLGNDFCNIFMIKKKYNLLIYLTSGTS